MHHPTPSELYSLDSSPKDMSSRKPVKGGFKLSENNSCQLCFRFCSPFWWIGNNVYMHKRVTVIPTRETPRWAGPGVTSVTGVQGTSVARWPGAPFAWRHFTGRFRWKSESTNCAVSFWWKIMAQQIWFWSFGWVFFPKHHIETIRKTSPKKQLMRKVGPNPVTPKKWWRFASINVNKIAWISSVNLVLLQCMALRKFDA